MFTPLRLTCLFFGLWILSVASISAQKPDLPTGVIPDGLGYNIHFTHARPGEMEMIAGSGAAIIRMDFSWGATEKEKGVYDFSAFEHLTDSLEKHGLRPLYILDYSNKHYDGGLSPHSEEGRTAFAHWAAAAAVHFKDRGILWEMYNEPNIGFWKPKPEPEKYILLALEVGRAIRQAAPNELYIGPATSGIPMGFLEQCFKAGLLEYWDAVSVHPYRQKGPETVAEEYAKLRWMIDKYAPQRAPSEAQRNLGVASTKKHIPILSAEWGYSSVWKNFDDELQGKMLPRQWMTNLAFDVPISIWYDWHDDGKDPKEPEHHFGTTNFEYKKDQTPVYDPKPSYVAAKTFNETFRGFRFNKRLVVGPKAPHPEEFVFVFDSAQEAGVSTPAVKLAAWTMSKEPKTISIPCAPGKFGVVSYLGEKLPDVAADENGLKLTVSDGPIYLTPENSDGYWNELANVKSQPLTVYRNVSGLERFNKPTIDIWSDPLAMFTPKLAVIQYTDVITANPAKIGSPFLDGNDLVVPVENPSGEKFSAQEIEIAQAEGFEPAETVRPLEFRTGQRSTILRFPVKTQAIGDYRFSVKAGDRTLVPAQTYRPFADFTKLDTKSLNDAWNVHPDGDAKVGSEQRIEIDGDKLKLTFQFDDGWKFVRIFPKDENVRKFEGKPKALALQAQGDGTPASINVRYRDSKGQTFQIHGGHLNDDSVRNLVFPLDGERASHWGGPNDGVIHYPIQLDSIIVDGTRKACGPGTVRFSSPVVIDE